jgi:hypothetical protein
VTTEISPRHYTDGDRVECFVDAEMINGRAVVWWLEFRFADGNWIIESSLNRNAGSGEEQLIGLPTRFAVEDDELIAELQGAARALLATLSQIDLGEV